MSNKPLRKIQDKHKKAKLVVFDMDGTLTKSKTDLDAGMAATLRKLLAHKKVAVIGGGSYKQFQNQFVSKLRVPGELLKNLFLFPTTATRFYRFNGRSWEMVYSQDLSKKQKQQIPQAFKKAFVDLNYIHPKKLYGKLLEDRGAQISFSFLGQKAPLNLKIKWRDKNKPLKLKVAATVQKYLPDLTVRAAGYTTVDVTRKGVDKEFGIRQIEKRLKIPLKDIIFVGDALFAGGNDSAALRTGIPCFAVEGPKETKSLIQSLLDHPSVKK